MSDQNPPNAPTKIAIPAARTVIPRPVARALNLASEAKIDYFIMSYFNDGFPIPRCFLYHLGQVLQKEQIANGLTDPRTLKATNSHFFKGFMKSRPHVLTNTIFSIYFRRHEVLESDIRDFLTELRTARSDPFATPSDLYYLSWARFPYFAPGQPHPLIYELSKLNFVNVLHCHSATGVKQEKPLFFQYGDDKLADASQLDNGVWLVPHHFTKGDMLSKWFDTCFHPCLNPTNSQTSETSKASQKKRVLIIDEDRANPSDQFKRDCLERNVHIVCIPPNLSPHFCEVDSSLGMRMSHFYQRRIEHPESNDWLVKYTEAIQSNLGPKIHRKWRSQILHVPNDKAVHSICANVQKTWEYPVFAPAPATAPPQNPPVPVPAAEENRASDEINDDQIIDQFSECPSFMPGPDDSSSPASGTSRFQPSGSRSGIMQPAVRASDSQPPESESRIVETRPVPSGFQPPGSLPRIFSPESLSSSEEEFFSARTSVPKETPTPSQTPSSGGNRLTENGAVNSSPRSFVSYAQPDNTVSPQLHNQSSVFGNTITEYSASFPANGGRSKTALPRISKPTDTSVHLVRQSSRQRRQSYPYKTSSFPVKKEK